MNNTKILILIGLVCVVAMTMGCIDNENKLGDVPQFVSMPTNTEKVPTPTTVIIDTEEFIDTYSEACDIFRYTSYESKLKANESWNMALLYYENFQFSNAGSKYDEAAGFYLIAKEQNLKAKILFEKAYKIAPTEYYKELCLLYIDAIQSESKMMNYMNSAVMHIKKACDYYEKGDCILGDYKKRECILGDNEAIESGKDIMRNNIELEIRNSLVEKIDNMNGW